MARSIFTPDAAIDEPGVYQFNGKRGHYRPAFYPHRSVPDAIRDERTWGIRDSAIAIRHLQRSPQALASRRTRFLPR